MKEREEERFVRESFATHFGARLRKIPETTTPTPDFDLIADDVSVAVLEVKLLERTPRTAESGWTTNELGILTRVDNAPKRIATLIHAGWKQLSTSHLPKVLVFVNDEWGIDVGDMEEAFNGRMFYGDENFGYYNTASAKLAAGRISEEKGKIDLYVWVDRAARVEPRFRFVSEAGHSLAVRFFEAPSTI